ncbi:MAG: RNA 2'-phosphotransferase [Myxococcales bacterium]|nr:RNA 2'-phosphotransferase [Myxococcales bacterium]
MKQNSVKLSKFVSFLLRHGAEENGLTLDDQGFTPLDEVWSLIQKRYKHRFRFEEFEEVLQGDKDGKKRFEQKDGLVRALYGHSKVKAIVYEDATPPTFLFHGTTPDALLKIQKTGLSPMQRQYVHLTIDLERARSVARRYSPNPIILRVHAADAHAAGIRFFQPDNEHFLSEPIPPQYLEETDL